MHRTQEEFRCFRLCLSPPPCFSACPFPPFFLFFLSAFALSFPCVLFQLPSHPTMRDSMVAVHRDACNYIATALAKDVQSSTTPLYNQGPPVALRCTLTVRGVLVMVSLNSCTSNPAYAQTLLPTRPPTTHVNA